MPHCWLCVVPLLLHLVGAPVGTYSSNAPISEISLPSLFESALPPALPGSLLMVPGTNLGHPGLTVRWCNSAGPCVQLKPVFSDTASVAIRVPGGGATVASVTPCYSTTRQEAIKSADVGSEANTCGPTLFGINAPKVSWIAAEGQQSNATLPGTVRAGTVLHLLGRSLAWNGTRCDGLKAPSESSSYSSLRNSVYQLQTADRHRGSFTQQVASVQAALQRLDPPRPHLDNVRTSANVTVSLRGDDGTETALVLPLISCFRVDAIVPRSVAPGHYIVALGNGLTPPLNVGTLLVAAPKVWPSKVFVPGEHCTNISACLAVAIATGGGTVQLPAGIVNMSLDDALAISGNVTLRGAGAGQTILSWDSHWSPPHCNGVSATGEVCGCHDDGGDIELACTDSAATISTVDFASIGTPSGDCGNFTVGKCTGDPTKAKAAVEAACLGKHKCSITCDIGHLNGGADPCYGVPKRVRVSVTCSKSPARVALDAGTTSTPPALISCSGDAKIVGLTVRSSLRLPVVGIAFEPGSADCVIESSNIEIDAQDYAITNAFTALSSTSFVVRDVNIVHSNGGQVCGSWPSQCAIFIATSSRGIVENASVIASCSGYSIDSSQSLFLDRVATVSIGNVSSEGQGFSSFRAPQVVEHIYQGRGVDIGNTFASWIDTTNPNHKNSQGRNEAMTLDGPYGLYLGLVDKTALSSDGCCQTLHTASPPPFAMPGRIAAVGAAAIVMQGYGIGMVSRVTAISADLRTPRHFPITDHHSQLELVLTFQFVPDVAPPPTCACRHIHYLSSV